MRRYLALLLVFLASTALGQEIDKSPRPMPNPKLIGAGTLVVVPVAEAAVPVVEPGIRPVRNPRYAAASEPESQPEVIADAGEILPRSLRPLRRPKALAERIAALKSASNAPGLGLSAAPEDEGVDLASIAPPTRKERRKKKRELESMEGAVCGVPSIKGQEIASIQSNVGGCGVPEAVAITSIAGVRLSQTATVDCTIAKALNSYINEVAQPAFEGKLVELRVAAHYVCRSRNNIKGAKISEHGKGKAIDIAAFVLANGTTLTVKDNYNKLLRRIYKAACPYFKTTLGPGSDGYHEDHFHFDTSARDSGAYCR